MVDYPIVVCNGWSEELCGDWRNPVPRTFERMRKCCRVLWDWSRKAFPNNAKLLASLNHRLALLREGQWSQESAAEADVVMAEIERVWDL